MLPPGLKRPPFLDACLCSVVGFVVVGVRVNLVRDGPLLVSYVLSSHACRSLQSAPGQQPG